MTENKLLLESVAEESGLNIIIIWQESEDELRRALGDRYIKKNSVKSHIKRKDSRKLKVLNSPFTKNILKHFSDTK